MSSLIPFSFESQSIRVVVLDGQPMFGARDVAVALCYANPSEAYNDHCKSLKKLSYSESLELGWETPNRQGEYVMPESDVYRLIVKSNKPEAERFERWVFEEVLPSIRKTGGYATPTPSPKLSREERYRLGVYRDAVKTARMMGFNENMALLSADNYCKNTLGTGVLAHMGATHLIADQRGKVYTPTELGKLLDPPLSAVKLNLALEAAGLQRKEMGGWLPCDAAEGLFEWADTGKKHSSGLPVKQLRWFRNVLERLPSAHKSAA